MKDKKLSVLQRQGHSNFFIEKKQDEFMLEERG